ncbi:coproporphyrinogen-III oxidase family protein [Clostridium sp.]|uniref:coproporphyrinogen-III oxidase family protein n=1 Tax=Clostridium sp. TaxID=1506 RepID=UPI003464DA3C
MELNKRAKSHHDSASVMEKLARGPRDLNEYLRDISEEGKARKKSSIYIHVPFCAKICTFCSMRRSLSNPTEDYHKLIIKEMENYSTLDYIKNSSFDAVYFGGGTPTTLETNGLREILRALKSSFSFTDDAEFTIETTVTELSEDKIDMFYKEGVNRFSVGVQTFSKRGRNLFGRKGDGDFAYNRLRKLKEAGFSNVNMDLIYSYENQNSEELLEDLHKIYDLDLAGFSLYSLINMKNSSLGAAEGLDTDKRFFNLIGDNSEKEGYKFLELTKMVKRDKYKYILSRHNGEDTLPLGAAAGGSLNDIMMMNPVNLEDYRASIDEFNKRKGMLFSPMYKELSRIKGELQRGIIPTSYSMIEGKEKIFEYIENLKKKELAVEKEDKVLLTREGLFWGNNISKEFLELLT